MTTSRRKNTAFAVILIAVLVLVAATAVTASVSGAKYVLSVDEQGVNISVISGVGYVYVKDGGSGDFSGSDADNACANLIDAYVAAATLTSSNKVIVVCGTLTLTTAENSTSAFNVQAAITSTAQGVDYGTTNSAKLVVNGTAYNMYAVTAFEKIAIEPNSSNQAIYANGNKLVFGTSVTVSNSTVSLYGGSSSGNVSSTELVLYSGTFGTVCGGGYGGSVTGTAKITAEAATITTIYGGGYNTGATVDNFDIRLKGTTVSNVYGGGYNSSCNVLNTVVADNVISLSGQTVVKGNLYGGGNKGVVSGNINININDTIFSSSGDTSSVTGDVFAAGNAGSVAGKITVNTSGSYIDNLCGGTNYSSATAAATDIEINVSGGNVAAVYGGSYQGGAISGNTVVNISGGTIAAVYGGSYSGGNIAGKTTVNVSGGTVTNVFGGSKSGATVAGTANVNVSGGTITTVYGGGDSANVTGVTTVHQTNGTVTTVYTGGNSGKVSGNSYYIYEAGTITSVYAGGKSGKVAKDSHIHDVAGTMTYNNFLAGQTTGTKYYYHSGFNFLESIGMVLKGFTSCDGND